MNTTLQSLRNFSSQETVLLQKKHLKEMGLGNRPNAAEALEPEDEEELYNCGAFGTENPDSLLSTLWFMNTVNFGLRGLHEHRQLKWGDIKLETGPTGNQCLVYNERVTAEISSLVVYIFCKSNCKKLYF